MQYGAAQDATTSVTSLTSTSNPTLSINNTATGFGADGLNVFSHGSSNTIYAELDTVNADGYAIWVNVVDATLGHGVVSQGGGNQLFLVPYGTAAPTGVHSAGEINAHITTAGKARVIACVQSGNPGTWLTLIHPDAAGALFPITPSRVYDSRSTDGPLATGVSRTVSVANQVSPTPVANVVPAGAVAIAYNVTITGTVGGNGFLSINPGGNTSTGTSALNWYASGQKAANASMVKLDASRQITVVCGGSATSTQFIIDVVGYYM
jgi:hypothetical protein